MKTKKILAGILSVAMMFISMSMTAYAEIREVATVGTQTYSSLTDAIIAAAEASSSDNQVTVTLNTDASGDGIFVDSGANIIIDLNYNQYTINGKLVGFEGMKSNGMQLLKDSNITIKNGSIIAGKKGYWNTNSKQGYYPLEVLAMNYSNLILDNVALDGIYLTGSGHYPMTLSNVNGTVNMTGCQIFAGKNTKGHKAYAFDISNGNGSYDGAKVTLFDTAVSGLIQIWYAGTSPVLTFKPSDGTADISYNKPGAYAENNIYNPTKLINPIAFTNNTMFAEYYETFDELETSLNGENSKEIVLLGNAERTKKGIKVYPTDTKVTTVDLNGYTLSYKNNNEIGEFYDIFGGGWCYKNGKIDISDVKDVNYIWDIQHKIEFDNVNLVGNDYQVNDCVLKVYEDKAVNFKDSAVTLSRKELGTAEDSFIKGDSQHDVFPKMNADNTNMTFKNIPVSFSQLILSLSNKSEIGTENSNHVFVKSSIDMDNAKISITNPKKTSILLYKNQNIHLKNGSEINIDVNDDVRVWDINYDENVTLDEQGKIMVAYGSYMKTHLLGTETMTNMFGYETDSGFYMDNGVKKGMIRYMFMPIAPANEIGINVSLNLDEGDYSKWKGFKKVNSAGNFGMGYGFGADICDIPENTELDYYGAAYYKYGDNIRWSLPISCRVNWNKQFTNYVPGGNN